ECTVRRVAVCCGTAGSCPICASCTHDVVFFFQAEDGIRAPLVTGVQTCALPIWDSRRTAIDRIRVGSERPVRPHFTNKVKPLHQIGRASCRERVESPVGAGSLKKKKTKPIKQQKKDRNKQTRRRTHQQYTQLA